VKNDATGRKQAKMYRRTLNKSNREEPTCEIKANASEAAPITIQVSRSGFRTRCRVKLGATSYSVAKVWYGLEGAPSASDDGFPAIVTLASGRAADGEWSVIPIAC